MSGYNKLPLDRRGFLKSSLAGLPLAAVLAEPRLARAAAESLESVSLTTAKGRQVSAALALPAKTPAPAILLVHEWWGLNDQIKSVAGALADLGYVALAVDLYGGQTAGDAEGAKALMQTVVDDEARDTLASWVAWLRGHDAVGDKIGTVGWCFGGGWALNAAIDSPVEATVVYYGRVNQPEAELARLAGPVMGHFATEDQWIDKEMVGGFEAKMTALGKPFTDYWYEAQHAFANPTTASYDEADAKLAWQRTTDFFAKQLMAM